MNNIGDILNYLVTTEDEMEVEDDEQSYALCDLFSETVCDGADFEFDTKYGKVSINTLKNFGGGEGGGELRYLILEVTFNGVTETWRRNGCYYSYHGTDWRDFEQVVKAKKTITVWKAI